MQVIIKKLILSATFLWILTCAWSQEKRSFRQLNQQYAELIKAQPLENFSSEIHTKVYQGLNKNVILQEDKGVVSAGSIGYIQYLSTNLYYVQIPESSVSVDSINKRCILAAPKEIQALTAVNAVSTLDSSRYSIRLKETADTYVFEITELYKQSDFQKSTVVFDKKSKLIKTLELVYWPYNFISESITDETKETPVLSMTYKTKLAVQNSEVILKEFNKIILRSETGYSLTPAFQDFSLVDLRLKTTK